MLFRKLSQTPVITNAKLRGRTRAAGSEFALASTCGSRRGSARSSASPKLVSAPLPGPTAFSTWPGYWAEATRSR